MASPFKPDYGQYRAQKNKDGLWVLLRSGIPVAAGYSYREVVGYIKQFEDKRVSDLQESYEYWMEGK